MASSPTFAQTSSGSEKTLIKYQVNATDTLVSVAARFGVKVCELRSLNGITGDDLWYKNELLVPNVGGDQLQHPDEDVLKQAEESLKVVYICRISSAESSVARHQLRRCNGNREEALEACKAISMLSKTYNISQNKAVTYLEQHRYCLTDSEAEIKDDGQVDCCLPFGQALPSDGGPRYTPLRPIHESTSSPIPRSDGMASRR
eukprot:GHVS01028920.1.p1 GENE.GHVS01028920.1~~GHVS01028920.1.p1  ORF type:complete len:203 (+),score=10.73 GHVS01028920.1:55-663(+)